MYHVDGNGHPIGNFQVMALSPQVPLKNISHIQELYRNLPQLHNPVLYPIVHQSYEPQNRISPEYSEQHHSTFFQTPFLKTIANKYLKPRYEHEVAKDQVIHKRNGYGWGDAGHHHHHGNSSALSALALLGFMFFLQLIQNSLQNNRQMLAAAALNATSVGVVAGRDNKQTIQYHRHRRSIIEMNKIPNTNEAEERPHKNTTTNSNEYHERANPPETHTSNINFRPNKSHHKTRGKSHQKTNNTTNENIPIEILKSSSVYCCQLIACKIGESIYDSLDATTGLLIRMLGATMIPRIPKKTWTGRLLKAFDRGSKKESCDSLYRKCGVFYNLFHNSRNTSEMRKRGTHKPD